MYEWLCSRVPRRLVNLLYGGWYVGLILLIALVIDKPAADFHYLRG